MDSDVIPKYLSHIAFSAPKGALGSLSKYERHFTQDYIKGIEKKILIFRTDKGLIDLDKEIDP